MSHKPINLPSVPMPIVSRNDTLNPVSETDELNELKWRVIEHVHVIFDQWLNVLEKVTYERQWNSLGARMVPVPVKCMWQQLLYVQPPVHIVRKCRSKAIERVRVATSMTLSVKQNWRSWERMQLSSFQFNRLCNVSLVFLFIYPCVFKNSFWYTTVFLL